MIDTKCELNVEGMLPFENMVADYVEDTNNHVLYRVTPIFKGDNLLASGVQMEAYSVEDKGKGVCFNVYCYNVQPGITIKYSDGSSKLSDGTITSVTLNYTKYSLNLICDNTPVRTLEDLQENFVIEDVLAYYNDKLLHRWLKVRGYSEELAKVEGITSSDEMDIIKELIEIFNVSVDKSKVDEEVYMLQFLAEREKLYAEYDRTHYLSKKVIEDYKNGYIELIKKS